MSGNEKPLKNVIKDIISRLEQREDGGGGEFITIWKKAVGKDASKHTRPVNLRLGKLVVNVSDSSRLYELTTRKRDIIKSINKQFNKKKVKEIRFKIGEV